MWGTNLDFAQVKLEFLRAIAPTEITVDASADADFRGNVMPGAKAIIPRAHENLRELYLTLFWIPQGSRHRSF